MNALSRHVVMLLLVAGLGGCSTLSDLFSWDSAAKLKQMKVIALADANQGQATELDLVFVYQADIAKTLPADAPGWFKQRDAIQAKYAGDIEVVSLEVPPGYVIASVALPERHEEALQVMVYANYVPETGQYPLTLSRFEEVVLTLQEDKFDFSSSEQ